MSTPQQPPRVFRSSPHHAKKHEKTSLFKNPGVLIVAAFGSLFVAYIFNFRGVATAFDRSFAHMNQNAQSHQATVASFFLHALPFTVGLMVLFLMLIFLRAGGSGSSEKSSSKKQSADARGVDAFVEAAAAEGISPRVARSTYRVLLPFVRKNNYLGVDDSLFRDLRLREEQLSDVYGSLLRLSDRRRRTGDEGLGIRGVMGLMMAVESSEDKTAAVAFTGKPARPFSGQREAATPVTLMAVPGPVAVEPIKPKKPSAVLVHPARLPRRELSMIRNRSLRGA